MDVSSPPLYRRLSRSGLVPDAGVAAAAAAAELPPYTRRDNHRRATVAQLVLSVREPTEHVFQLVDRGKPWASLRVRSSAKSAKSLPTFYEHENVNGSLDLNVEKTDSIQAVTATVTGRIVLGAHTDDAAAFLNIVVPIWNKAPDAPRLPSPSPGAQGSKLSGHCHWPFSIPLPKTVTLPDGQSYRLPETLLERHSKASIQYDLSITISRGKLRADSRIKTAFGYVPSTKPEMPSILRQMAYQQNLPLPGPSNDPEGWYNVKPVVLSGQVFKSRMTSVTCRLSLAKPLYYTRGSIIPCVLVLEGQDSQALDLLSTPTSISLMLRRRLRFSDHKKRPDESFMDVGKAVWWPSREVHSIPTARYLEGEIKLVKDLKPTSAMGDFSISYSVVLDPFEAVGFKTSSNAPLLAQPVDIATAYCRGPRPIAYAPPSYDNTYASQRHDDDFYAPKNASVYRRS